MIVSMEIIECNWGGRRPASRLLSEQLPLWHVTNLPRNSIPTASGDNYRPRRAALTYNGSTAIFLPSSHSTVDRPRYRVKRLNLTPSRC